MSSGIPHPRFFQGRCQRGHDSQFGPRRRVDEEVDAHHAAFGQVFQILLECLHRETVIFGDAETPSRIRPLQRDVDQVKAARLSRKP